MTDAARAVVLDTDLGSDVDDALALAVLLGSPQVSLLGVTTVYGDTMLRARVTARLLRLAGGDELVARVPVHAGLGAPLSGREVWWAGHEGALHDGLEAEPVASEDAVAYLVDTVLARPGEVDVIAIGPLTNVAAAIAADARFAPAVRRLWIMGGIFDGSPGFDGSGAEHNFRSDDAAAATVFSSGIPTTVAGIEVTGQVRLGRPERDGIAATGPLGAMLAAEIDQWWLHWNETENVPHDPLVVLALTHPALFGLGPAGTVSITVGAPNPGFSVFTADEAGPVRLLTAVEPRAALAAILAGVDRAARPR